jgi:multidrug resistance efflux pump
MSHTLTRGLFWLALVSAVAVGLVSTSVISRRAVNAHVPPVGSEPAAAGAVCFGTVDLEHGVTSLYPFQLGRVARILVHENQTVAGGAVLLALEDATARSRLAEAEAALELSRLNLRQARRLPEKHREQVAQQENIRQATSARLAAARQLHARRSQIVQPSLVNAVELATSELQVRELEALERADAQRLAEVKSHDVDVEIRRAEYECTVAEARRDQARIALDECSLKAPRAGTVLRIFVGPGAVLTAERVQPAILFAGSDRQIVRVDVEQEFAPRIKEGAPAIIRDEADERQSWRGRVEQIADWYSQHRPVLNDPSQMTDVRTLECRIALEPGQSKLRLGQTVRVSIGAASP